MFDAPSRLSNLEPAHQATGWEYLGELAAMADWLTTGPDASSALTAAVSGVDVFRGTETVVRWIHRIAEAHGEKRNVSAKVVNRLDDIVEGVNRHGPFGDELREEVAARLALLELLCCIPDNYRCALLLKEGAGLSVERTAAIMGVSIASLRSILYRARQTIRTSEG